MKNKLSDIPPFHWMCYLGIVAAFIACTMWANRVLATLPIFERIGLMVVSWLVIGIGVFFTYIIVKFIVNLCQTKRNKVEADEPVEEQTEEAEQFDPKEAPLLPASLNTSLARRIFERALQQGMMVREGDKYRWVYCDGLKVALAYMLGRIYKRTAKAIFPSTALESLFGMSGLKKALDQYQTLIKGTPIWKEDIDHLFDDGAFEE